MSDKLQILEDAAQTWEKLAGEWRDRAAKQDTRLTRNVCREVATEYQMKAKKVRDLWDELREMGLWAVCEA